MLPASSLSAFETGACLGRADDRTKEVSLVGLMGLAKLVTSASAATPETSVMEACRIMDKTKTGAVAVLDDGELCGIFTHQDLVRRVVLAKGDPEELSMKDVMTTQVDSLSGDRSSGDALRLMVENGYTHLPIVKEDGKLVGMLSLPTLLEDRVDALAQELDSVTRYFSADGIGGG